MERGIKSVIKHYQRSNFTGSLRFAISETNGMQNIDLSEDNYINDEKSPVVDMSCMDSICERIKFGWILVYIRNGNAVGFDYKINYQGVDYKRLEKKCVEECSVVRVVVKKSNT